MQRDTRPISWLKGARKDFEEFPQGAQIEIEHPLRLGQQARTLWRSLLSKVDQPPTDEQSDNQG